MTRRDKDATRRTLGTFCRERDWSKKRLIHELQNGLPYRTIPEGYVIEWDDPFLWPFLNVEASEISIPYGTVVGTIVPPPFTTHAFVRGVTLRIEVLLPDAPTDAEVPPSSASAPAASPAPPRAVSEADLRRAVRATVEEHPPGSRPLDDERLCGEVERRLGVQIARNRILAARDEVAPHFKL